METTEKMCPNCNVAMVNGVCPKCGMKAEDVQDMAEAPKAEMPAEEASAM